MKLVFLMLQKDEIHFGEVDWLSDMGIFGEQIPQEPMAAAEVPQLPMLQTGPYSSPLRSTKLGFSQKNARTEYREHYDDEEEEEEHFTVPDLGWVEIKKVSVYVVITEAALVPVLDCVDEQDNYIRISVCSGKCW